MRAVTGRDHRLILGVAMVAFSSLTARGEDLDATRLLDPGHLVEVRIEVPEADWDKIRVQSRDFAAFFGGATEAARPYTYVKADVWIDGVKIESVGIRKKGLFGSADIQRPSLKIKFDEFVDQKPIKGLSRLTLNNNKQDTAQVSQLLTYKLFRDAGVHAPRSNLAHVTVNGTDLGIYTNVESIKKPFLEHSFGNNSGNLYEGTLTDFYPKSLEKVEAKTNEDDNNRDDIAALANLLAADGELSLAAIEKVVDLDSFMRYWVLEGMIRFWDGYASNQNNYFVYMSPENGLGYFIPWGADAAFSARGGPFGSGAGGATSIYAQSMLTNRLYHTDGIPERYRKTVLSLLDEVWKEEELLGEIDKAEKLISGHLHERQRGTKAAMDDVREFIKTRREVLRDELTDWPAEVPPEPRKPSYNVKVGTLAGSFSTKFTAGRTNPNARSSEAGETKLQLELDGKTVELEGLAVVVSEFETPRFGRGGFGGFGRGGGGPDAPPQPARINVVFSGSRKPDGDRITISFLLGRDSFKKSNEFQTVSGSLREGQASRFGGGFGGFGGGQSVTGKLKLTKAGTEAGDDVEGVLEMDVVETRGGFFGRRRQPRGGFGRGGFGRGGFGGGGGAGFGGGTANRGAPMQRPARPARPRNAEPVPSIQSLIDTNNDGKLSADEIKNAPAALRRFDQNGDGEVSADELRTSPKSLKRD